MKVVVRLFARAKDLAGTDLLLVELPPGATVGQLRRELTNTVPALSALLDRCAIAVADEFANDATQLADSMETAILPPVSGGMDIDAHPGLRRVGQAR